MSLGIKDLLGIQELSTSQINLILDTALPMKEILQRRIKKVPTLRGRTLVNLFYEPSTRTRTSFELAAKYLSADTVNISKDSSSIAKGESLQDTASTVTSLGADFIVLRHPMAGAAHFVAKKVKAAVINAGDGVHEHPTQALLDLFTVREKKGKLAGLKMTIIGDILHSRVARSNVWGFTKTGVEVRLVGPSTLIPPEIEKMGAKVFTRLEEALEGVDIVYVLRLQLERQQSNFFPSLKEYTSLFGLNYKRLALAKSDTLVLHPGPINRGIEISTDIADAPQSQILEQVTNGVAIRMAVLYLLTGGRINSYEGFAH